MKIVIEDSSNTERVLKTALTGNSGTGKTYSALFFATMWEKLCGKNLNIGVIDTENYSTSNLKESFKFKLINLDQNEADINTYIEAIKMFVNNGCNFLIVDSISPAWDGEKGVLGTIAKINRGKNVTPQQWATVKRSNKLLVDYLCSLNIPVIVTVKTKDSLKMETNYKVDQNTGSVTKVLMTGKEYDKLIQDKGFLFGFDLVCQMQKDVYQFPNGQIFTFKELDAYAKDKNMIIDDLIQAYKIKTLNYYCSLDKSRYQFESRVVPFNKLFVVRVYYANKGLNFSKSIYSLHPELFTQYKDANSLIDMLKQSNYNFYENDINLIKALF